jgi:LPXTG-motif cell wall-anchored protein
VLPTTGGPAAGILGLGLLAVIAGAVVLLRDRRRRDEETA